MAMNEFVMEEHLQYFINDTALMHNTDRFSLRPEDFVLKCHMEATCEQEFNQKRLGSLDQGGLFLPAVRKEQLYWAEGLADKPSQMCVKAL